jgi:AcrR family transcriptional regulator
LTSQTPSRADAARPRASAGRLATGGGRTRRTRAQAREQIRDAAAAVFVELGYDAASLDEIAHRVGVTRAGILYHFHSKDALLVGVVAPLLADVEDLLARTAPAAGDTTPSERRELLNGMFDLLVRHRNASDLVVRYPSTIATLDIGPTVAKYAAEIGVRLSGSAYGVEPSARLRVAIALAAFRGLAASRPQIDLADAEQRAALVAIIEHILEP